ncbi:MAG: hypothetical protein Q8N61_01715 [bacterium]|nr:hypothetical protein [bacterium]
MTDEPDLTEGADSPCAEGLTAACFKAYPEWARKVLAYKLLMLMLPAEVSEKLPGKIKDIGKSLPAKWLKIKVKAAAKVRTRGISASHIHAPFSGGPLKAPRPAPALKTYTKEYVATATEWLGNSGTPWATKRDTATTGAVALPTISPFPSITAYNQGTYFDLWRFVFKFNFASLPSRAQMISGYLSIKLATGWGKTACIQQAPNVTWNDKNDYIAFSGDAENPHALIVATEIFNLSAASLAYCKTHTGQLVYFMAREYDHDFLNSAPTAGQRFEAQFYTHVDANPALRPTLNLVYKA